MRGAAPRPRRGRQPAESCRFYAAFYLLPEGPTIIIAQLCLECGADVDRGAQGLTPLYNACWYGRLDAARLLIDSGATLDGTSRPPLAAACQQGHLDVATLLLDRGADVDRAYESGWTALHGAGYEGDFHAVRLCLKRGADINLTTSTGHAPHDVARINNQPTMAAWLLRIHSVGWSRYLSEPRYKMVVLRALVASKRARRERPNLREKLLDFLFPGDQPRPYVNEPEKPRQPCLPNGVFPLVVRYYWGGEPRLGPTVTDLVSAVRRHDLS